MLLLLHSRNNRSQDLSHASMDGDSLQVCPTKKQCTQKEETQQGDELAQTSQHRLDADRCGSMEACRNPGDQGCRAEGLFAATRQAPADPQHAISRLSRVLQQPLSSSMARLRSAKFIAGAKRLVIKFPSLLLPQHTLFYTDVHQGGDRLTRRGKCSSKCEHSAATVAMHR